MLSIMTPSFLPREQHSSPAPYRPTRPSPLSSSPLRAASPPSLARDTQTTPRALDFRQTQSSPITFTAQDTPSRPTQFKYATRPTKPTPFTQRRETVQEGRRKAFLQGVRQRADEKRWNRRGGEQELEKLEWLSENRDWQRAKARDSNGVIYEYEIEDEDVMTGRQEGEVDMTGLDDEMVDMMEREEEDEETKAFALSRPEQHDQDGWRDEDETRFSDDEDYDSLFTEYLSQERQEQPEDVAAPQQMDMT